MLIDRLNLDGVDLGTINQLGKGLDDLTQAMGISKEMLGKKETIKKAKFKLNGGAGALLCSKCNKIIKDGSEFTQEEIKAFKGEIKLEARYCDWCNK